MNVWKLFSFNLTALSIGLSAQAVHAQIYIPVPVYNYYGSFAYSKSTHNLGIAWNYRTSHAAEAKAMEVCVQSGANDCLSIGWFANTCAAFALDPNGVIGISTDRSKEVAQQEALDDCHSRDGESCEILEVVCSL